MKVKLINDPESLRSMAVDKIQVKRKKNQEVVEIYHVSRKVLDKLYKKKEYPKRW